MDADKDEIRMMVTQFASRDGILINEALIDYCLSLTPTQRLQRAQALADTVVQYRRSLGLPDDPFEDVENILGTGPFPR